VRETVIISSWRRADHLQACFDALRNARSVEDKRIWVFQNNRQDAGVDLKPVHDVITAASARFPHFRLSTHDFQGWQLSQYEAWQTVYEYGAPRAYFFSDDVICTPDFFEWHDVVQEDGNWFGSTAWRPPTGNIKPFDLAAYYQISFPNEISMGLCVKRESIKRMLQSSPDWCPQERMIAEDWKIVMPYVQRCYHVGTRSSNLDSVGENTGPAVDAMPNPIPDYGRQTVVLKF
jgi:hypothetical protein